MKMFGYFILLFLTVICAAPVEACDGPRVVDLMRQSDYSRAKELALKESRKSPYCLTLAADASFKYGSSAEASDLYARAWLLELDEAYDEVKGSSKFGKFLSEAMVVLAAATDSYNAQQGASAARATESTVAAHENYMARFQESVGSESYRKEGRQAIKDLKSFLRRSTSTFYVVAPSFNDLPGAAMARVLSGNVVCNVVPVAYTGYLASTKCLGDGGDQASMFVTKGPGLRPSEFAQVTDASAFGSADLALLTVAEGPVVPSRFAPVYWAGAGPDPTFHKVQYGITWFAAEFNYFVPVYRSCSDATLDDCAYGLESDAIVWMKPDRHLGWQVYGFVLADGRIVPVTLEAQARAAGAAAGGGLRR